MPSIFTPDSNDGPSRLDVDAAIGSNKLHYSLLLPTPGHSDQAIYLDNLALGTQGRFEQQDVPFDLDEAIEVDRAALLFSPQDHSIRLASLNNLALRLQYGFQKNGVPSDLDEAIELRRAALFLLSSESPGPSSLIRVTLHIFPQQGVPSVLGMVATLHRTEIFLPGLDVG